MNSNAKHIHKRTSISSVSLSHPIALGTKRNMGCLCILMVCPTPETPIGGKKIVASQYFSHPRIVERRVQTMEQFSPKLGPIQYPLCFEPKDESGLSSIPFFGPVFTNKKEPIYLETTFFYFGYLRVCWRVLCRDTP